MRNISTNCMRLFFVACVATLFMAALPVQTVHAFMDNFEEDELGEEWHKSPTGLDTSWVIDKDGALMFNGVGGDCQMMTGEENWTNYTVECDVMIETSANYPAGLRTYIDPDTGTHYALWFYPIEKTMKLFSGNDWNINGGLITLSTYANFSPDMGKFFHIKIVHDGDNIEVWYGKDKDSITKVIEAKDSKFKNGLFGFDGYNQPIHFDNLLIVGQGIPISKGEAVDSRGKLAVTWGELKVR